MRPRISIRGSVRPTVGPSVGWSVDLSVMRFFLNCKNEGFSSLYVIREAQEHHRNVELHLKSKVGLLVRPSIQEIRESIS